MTDTDTALHDIDARIAAEHHLEIAAYDQGQDGVAEWYALDIERLTNLRRIVAAGTPTIEALIRMRLRGLSERYARASWAGDTAAAETLRGEIDRLERGHL